MGPVSSPRVRQGFPKEVTSKPESQEIMGGGGGRRGQVGRPEMFVFPREVETLPTSLLGKSAHSECLALILRKCFLRLQPT